MTTNGAAPTAIVFDFDGTLVDSRRAIRTTLRRACVDAGVAEPDDATIDDGVGLALDTLIDRAFADLPPAQRAQLATGYRTHYATVGEPLITPYDGAWEMVDSLRNRGVICTIATGKSLRGLQRSMDRFALHTRFAAWRTVDCVAQPKPAPDMVLSLAAHLGVPASTLIVVGDTEWDLRMAHSAGSRAIGVTWGFHTRRRLVDLHPYAVLDTMEALSQRLHALFGV